MKSIIYGPVASWRLGRSLGIDLLSTNRKTCSFNCIYCQLGKTAHLVTEPGEFVSLEQLGKEISLAKQIKADYATFSGMGEPTLSNNLGMAIDMVKSALNLPVAVLTNSSLMSRENTRCQLSHADTVIAKLDAPNEKLFTGINRQAFGLHLNQIVDGIKQFRNGYKGNLALQMMFVEANKGYAPEMAALAREISPGEVQINTPLRPCGVKPLSPDDIAAIKMEFASFENVVTVYESPKPEVMPFDMANTLRRRPVL